MTPTSLKQKTTGKRLESLKFVGGSKFMKELQKTVFLAAYESVVFSSGKSVTDKEQKEMLRRSILGSDDDPDVISLPEQMVLGINQFAHLYDDVPMENNDDRNAASSLHGSTAGNPDDLIGSSHRNEYDKRLKDCFFPQKSSGGKLNIYANKPDGITKSLFLYRQSCELQRRFYGMGGRHLHVSKKLKVTIKMERFHQAGQFLIIIGMCGNGC